MRTVSFLTRRGLMACGAVAATLLAGCAAMAPRQVTLTESQLQTLIERQFPREQRLMEIVDTRLSRPVLRLLPERNRLGTEIELSATERLSGRAMRGRMALDYALRYEPSDATLRLTQVRVQDLNLDFAGTVLAGQGARLSALLAERLLDDFVVYRVADDQRELLVRAGITGAEVAVTAAGVELRFNDKR